MNTEPVYQVRGVTKKYDNVLALDGVDFAVAAGEVVGLVGDNGAGKSTLVKVLSGAHRPDQGEMLLDGALVQWHSLQEALESGIETLYQDSSLAPWEALDTEISGHEKLLTELPAQVAPDLVKAFAVGPDTASEMLIVAGDNPERIRSEAAFARLCGVAPIPASSGMITRHRLNRGGHRQANAALYRVVIVGLQHHEPTRADVARRITEGKTKSEIVRCLKRLLARELGAAMRPIREARPPLSIAA